MPDKDDPAPVPVQQEPEDEKQAIREALLSAAVMADEGQVQDIVDFLAVRSWRPAAVPSVGLRDRAIEAVVRVIMPAYEDQPPETVDELRRWSGPVADAILSVLHEAGTQEDDDENESHAQFLEALAFGWDNDQPEARRLYRIAEVLRLPAPAEAGTQGDERDE